MKTQMTKLKSFFLKFWPSLIVLGVILYATLSSDPLGADEIPAIPHIDKLIHASMMGGLVGAIIFDIQRADKNKIINRRTLILIASAVMIFGILDEIAQTTMANGRSGDWLDLVADWAGVWVAFFTAPPAVRKVLKIKR